MYKEILTIVKTKYPKTVVKEMTKKEWLELCEEHRKKGHGGWYYRAFEKGFYQEFNEPK